MLVMVQAWKIVHQCEFVVQNRTDRCYPQEGEKETQKAVQLDRFLLVDLHSLGTESVQQG